MIGPLSGFPRPVMEGRRRLPSGGVEGSKVG